MARIVRKYGGSSLRDVESIRRTASRIADIKWRGDEVVVVVSALASTTDDLVAMARELNPDPPNREMDMLLSVGERISCSLLAMAIEAEGIGAVSFTGSQVGIITDTRHGEARIVDIRPFRLLEALERDMVVIVAGFQGVSVEKEITTLGRGGSDMTAVAIAAAIKADRCELMKDVNGLHTADPKVVEDARLIEALDYNSALGLSDGGAEVLQSEAGRIARDHGISLLISSAESDAPGTIITDAPFDCGDIVGISCRDNLLRRQGCGEVADTGGRVRFIENRGRWILWREGKAGEDAPLSGITVVTSGHPVYGLHEAVTGELAKQGIPTFGQIEQARSYWVCVETERAEEAMRIIHGVCINNGWIRKKSPDG